MTPSDLFPSDDEVDELITIQEFSPLASEILTTTPTMENYPSPPTNDYVIFEATRNIPYKDIYPPYNDDLGDYFDMLYISYDPNPQSVLGIVIHIQGVSPTFLRVRVTCNTLSSTHSTSHVMRLLSAHTHHLGSTLPCHGEHSPTPILPPFHVEAHMMGALPNVELLRVDIHCPPPISPCDTHIFPEYSQKYVVKAKYFIPPK